MGFLLIRISLGNFRVIFFNAFISLFLNFIFFICFHFCGRFVWDEAKYPTMSPLREIVDGIHTQIAKIEDDLKVSSVVSSIVCI